MRPFKTGKIRFPVAILNPNAGHLKVIPLVEPGRTIPGHGGPENTGCLNAWGVSPALVAGPTPPLKWGEVPGMM